MNADGIVSAVRQAGLDDLKPGVAERFASYLSLLLKWNAKVNLTATRDAETIVHRHFLDCIQCAQALPGVSTLLDFGSGAGLPGIPIALCCPEIHVTLAESQHKKSAFLREAVRTLALNAEVFDSRVETMPPDMVFEAVTLRAVDNMETACRTARTHVAKNGWLVLFTTESGMQALRSALPQVASERKLLSVSLDRGILWFGQLADDSKLFHVEQS